MDPTKSRDNDDFSPYELAQCSAELLAFDEIVETLSMQGRFTRNKLQMLSALIDELVLPDEHVISSFNKVVCDPKLLAIANSIRKKYRDDVTSIPQTAEERIKEETFRTQNRMMEMLMTNSLVYRSERKQIEYMYESSIASSEALKNRIILPNELHTAEDLKQRFVSNLMFFQSIGSVSHSSSPLVKRDDIPTAKQAANQIYALPSIIRDQVKRLLNEAQCDHVEELVLNIPSDAMNSEHTDGSSVNVTKAADLLSSSSSPTSFSLITASSSASRPSSSTLSFSSSSFSYSSPAATTSTTSSSSSSSSNLIPMVNQVLSYSIPTSVYSFGLNLTDCLYRKTKTPYKPNIIRLEDDPGDNVTNGSNNNNNEDGECAAFLNCKKYMFKGFNDEKIVSSSSVDNDSSVSNVSVNCSTSLMKNSPNKTENTVSHQEIMHISQDVADAVDALLNFRDCYIVHNKSSSSPSCSSETTIADFETAVGNSETVIGVSEIATDGSETAIGGSKIPVDDSEIAVDSFRTAVDGSETAIGGSKIAVGSSQIAVHGSETTICGSEVAADGSEIAVDGSKITVDDSEIAVDGSETAICGSEVAVNDSKTAIGSLEITIDGSETAISGSEMVVDSSETTIGGSKIGVDGSETAMCGSEVAVDDPKTAIGSSEIAIDGTETAINGSETTIGGSKIVTSNSETAVAVVSKTTTGSSEAALVNDPEIGALHFETTANCVEISVNRNEMLIDTSEKNADPSEMAVTEFMDCAPLNNDSACSVVSKPSVTAAIVPGNVTPPSYVDDTTTTIRKLIHVPTGIAIAANNTELNNLDCSTVKVGGKLVPKSRILYKFPPLKNPLKEEYLSTSYKTIYFLKRCKKSAVLGKHKITAKEKEQERSVQNKMKIITENRTRQNVGCNHRKHTNATSTSRQSLTPKSGQATTSKSGQAAVSKSGQAATPKSGQAATPKSGQAATPKSGQTAQSKPRRVATPKSTGTSATPSTIIRKSIRLVEKQSLQEVENMKNAAARDDTAIASSSSMCD